MANTTTGLVGASGANWTDIASHRLWLMGQAENLFAFFERHSRDPNGGFFALDDNGNPITETGTGHSAREIHVTTRMIHSYSIGHLMGRPGSEAMIDHGMQFLWNGHRDTEHGGYYSDVAHDGATSGEKQAYGHAFVLLAASSAKAAGHPDADRLLADITDTLLRHFWEDDAGAVAEEFTRDWQPLSDYRGQNSNMHLTEALMAAFEVTQDDTYLKMADRVAELIVAKHAAGCDWRLPEHFTENWELDRNYQGDPVFRPEGTTPGHWLEWARLLIQLWEFGKRRHDWMPKAAASLFENAIGEGWNHTSGGFYYTLDWNGAPNVATRYWWPSCEGIGAAVFLRAATGEARYEEWYRKIWNFSASHFIDNDRGGWFPQVDETGQPSTDPFFGKLDIYHSLQACVIPLLPANASIIGSLAGGFVLDR
jgi:sulfoquinovose isomerase